MGNPNPGPGNKERKQLFESQKKEGKSLFYNHFLRIEDNIVKGAFGMGGCWITDLRGADGFQVEVEHSHDSDEIIGFVGSDSTRPYELGAELELWLDGEKYVITSSCLIFIPAGMMHCPLYIRKLDRPVFQFGATVGKRYVYDIG